MRQAGQGLLTQEANNGILSGFHVEKNFCSKVTLNATNPYSALDHRGLLSIKTVKQKRSEPVERGRNIPLPLVKPHNVPGPLLGSPQRGDSSGSSEQHWQDPWHSSDGKRTPESNPQWTPNHISRAGSHLLSRYVVTIYRITLCLPSGQSHLAWKWLSWGHFKRNFTS